MHTGCTTLHVHPPPPGHVHPPPQPERLVMSNKNKMQVCLPKHNYKLDNNLFKVESRAVDPHSFDVDPDPAQNLDADPDRDPERGGGGGGGLVSQKCASPLAKS
jgi:hypothetical protein